MPGLRKTRSDAGKEPAPGVRHAPTQDDGARPRDGAGAKSGNSRSAISREKGLSNTMLKFMAANGNVRFKSISGSLTFQSLLKGPGTLQFTE